MRGSKNTYWGDIVEGISTLFTGLKLTLKHFGKGFKKNRPPIGVDHPDYMKHDEGVFTLQYPNESFPVPDNGRYRLDNEIEDCIVCDKCVKICPVNCIDIEMIRSSEEIRKTSDGSSVRLYASKFDIDMAKCMFCGLCTTVCPTECLTMTKTYDFSEFKLTDLVYNYTDLSPEQATQKKDDWDVFQEEKKKKAELKKAEVVKGESASLPKVGAASKPKLAGIKVPVPKAKSAGIKIPLPSKKTTEQSEDQKVLVPMPKLGSVKPKSANSTPKNKEQSTVAIKEEEKIKMTIPKPKTSGMSKPTIPKKKED